MVLYCVLVALSGDYGASSHFANAKRGPGNAGDYNTNPLSDQPKPCTNPKSITKTGKIKPELL